VRAPDRPAFYALAPGGWRDYVTLLHLPYTAWHLGYVAIGAACAAEVDLGRTAWTVVAFFLGVGVAAHALDELHGRPLRTAIPGRMLIGLAAASLAGAVAIGIAGVREIGPGLAIFIVAGALAVPLYNLELIGGRVHGDHWFALLWGAFPVLVGAYAQTGTLPAAALPAAAAAYALSHAQRRLSSWVRMIRRNAESATGELRLRDGARIPLTADQLVDAAEGALRAMAVAVPLLGIALVLART
jgi:hypothetical protein